MRTLLLLRGVMGSGKSTFIKENRLKPYTLNLDTFRRMLSNPIMNDGYMTTNQRVTQHAAKLLHECLENRMKRGDFTVIDATHISQKNISFCTKLAEEYRYSVYCYQIDVPLNVLLDRNKARQEIEQVPEEVIIRAYNLLQETSLPSKVKRIYSLSEIDNFYIENITDKYDKVEVIGDIHSCATVLKEYLKTYNENTLYIFVGDYFDRGIEDKETWEIIKSLYTKNNIILLEGNHEKWIKNFGEGIDNLPKAAKITFHEITKDMTGCEEEDFKKELRMFVKKLRQIYCFEFHGKKFIVNHGGVAYLPKLTYIATRDFIYGYSKHETEVDKIYENNYIKGLCQDYIQIHGHRGTTSTEHSISLEGEVEFGGYLKWLEITPTSITENKLKNNIFDINFMQNFKVDNNKNQRPLIITDDEEINTLLNSNLISVKENDFNTYSLNFSDTVFFKQIWNNSTVKARGLFVDRDTGEVVARSYNKFFNFGEAGIADVQIENLKNKLQYPIKIVHKYNGFLGIMSVYKKTGEFILASKSLTNGEYTGYFKNIFYKIDRRIHDKLKQILTKYNASATFEVISTLDVHTVRYGVDKLYLLDFIENKLHINGLNIDDEFSEKLKIEFIDSLNKDNIYDDKFLIAEVAGYVNSFDELLDFNDKVRSKTNIEGFVYKDARGFMFKFKVDYYNKWKHRKRLVNKYLKNINEFNMLLCNTVEDAAYMYKVKDYIEVDDTGEILLKGKTRREMIDMCVADLVIFLPEDENFDIETSPYSVELKEWVKAKEQIRLNRLQSKEAQKALYTDDDCGYDDQNSHNQIFDWSTKV